MAQSLIQYDPNSNLDPSYIPIWDLDIKAFAFVEILVDLWKIWTSDSMYNKMGADKAAENTPNALNLSTQIVCPRPKVWDFAIKKTTLVVRSPW